MTSFDDLDLNKSYTYADYLTWRFQERVELFLGKVVKMSPAPNRKHQSISWRISLIIGNFIKDKNCQAFTAPFDVRLPVSLKKGKIDTVVQPDISVICDETKLDEQGCNGAPDLIIEILSKSTSRKDVKDKYELYEENGVQEYWIVDPTNETLLKYVIKDGRYVGEKLLSSVETIQSSVFPDLSIELPEIFKENQKTQMNNPTNLR